MGGWFCAYCGYHSSSALLNCDSCGRGRPESFTGGSGGFASQTKTQETGENIPEEGQGGPNNTDDRHTPPPPAKRARMDGSPVASAAAGSGAGTAAASSGGPSCRARGGAFMLNPTASSKPDRDIDVTRA